MLLDFAARGRISLPEPPPALLRKMLAAGVGGPVPEEYLPMIREEMMLDDNDPKTVHWRTRLSDETLAGFHVVIIGAGVSGLGMAIKPKGSRHSVRHLRKEPDGRRHLAGEFRIPAAGRHAQSFYSLSFEPNHDWPDHFSRRDELWKYMERLADQYDLRRHIRFETEVTSAVYDASRAVWSVTTRDTAGREAFAMPKCVVITA